MDNIERFVQYCLYPGLRKDPSTGEFHPDFTSPDLEGNTGLDNAIYTGTDRAWSDAQLLFLIAKWEGKFTSFLFGLKRLTGLQDITAAQLDEHKANAALVFA